MIDWLANATALVPVIASEPSGFAFAHLVMPVSARKPSVSSAFICGQLKLAVPFRELFICHR